jgi:ubiquitin C-terminal hydrolase
MAGIIPIGLHNRGNTCFINCIEQCFRCLEKFFNQSFLRNNQLGHFDDHRQHDVHEYYLFELEKLEKQASFETLFQGYFTTTVSFPCGHQNQHKEPFLDLSVPCYGTMEEMINSLESNDDVSSSCDTCSFRGRAEKTMKVTDVPKVITFHIKRFDMYNNKINHPIDVPIRWTFTRGKKKYALQCFIVHIGGFFGGHYICFVRYGERWFRCDDATVKEERSIATFLKNAYMIFYTQLPDDPKKT